MGKIRLEWKEGSFWKYVDCNIQSTRNNNLMAKSGGVPYVFRDLKEGTAVVKLQEGKWIRVGRVTKYQTIFLGEGLSYEEANDKRFEENMVKKFEFPIMV